MKDIFFSIIIPTYNRVKELQIAVDSIMSQKFNNWELIIIDNYSTDKTKEMIKKYGSKKIKFFSLHNNGNIAKSRNFGIKRSKGKFLAFLDSDDYWTSDKLSYCAEIINKNKDIKLIYHDMEIDEKKIFLKKRKISYLRKLTKPVFNDLISNGPTFATSSAIVEKKIFNKIGQFSEDKNLITWEDYDAWIRLSKKTNSFYKISKVLGTYTFDGDNTLKPNRSIRNIFYFKKNYLDGKSNKLPNWCNYSLMRSYYVEKDYKKSIKYLKQIKLQEYSLVNKIKLLFFLVMIKIKISFNYFPKIMSKSIN